MKRISYSIDLQLKLHMYISLLLFLLSELRELKGKEANFFRHV